MDTITKLGSELKVGDAIKVWWSPGFDTITALKPYYALGAAVTTARMPEPTVPSKAFPDPVARTQPQRAAPSPERNAPCPCGSGKKFKKCCYLSGA